MALKGTEYDQKGQTRLKPVGLLKFQSRLTLLVAGGAAVRLVLATTAIFLLVSCAPAVVKTEGPKKPARKVLILTGFGMVPWTSQDPRVEDTWLKVVTMYTNGLTDAINAAGLYGRVHIKKSRAEKPEAALARLVSDEQMDVLLQVTVNLVRNSSDNTHYLRVNLMPLEYVQYSNGTRKVVTHAGATKQYPILSTTQPDLRQVSVPDLAKDFVKELREQGHLE